MKVHREIQKRDIEVGRNLGNWILRWLDRMKPAVQIQPPGDTIRLPNKLWSAYSGPRITAPGFWYQESRRRLVNSSRNLLVTAYPTVSRLLRRHVPVMNNIQYRRLVSGTNRMENGVIRSDIMQWLSYR